MDGSNAIFIVLPIVALVTLVILVGLPYIGDRAGRPPGAGHSRGRQAQGQIPDRSAGTGAAGSDAIGPGPA